MNFKTLLIINAVIAFLSGIICVLAPTRLLSMYDITLIPMGYVIYQFWGATLAGLGMLTWFMRNTKESEIQKALALSLFITYGMSCFLAIRGQFVGANNFGWFIVVLYVILTLSFGYFRFIILRMS